MLACLAIRRRGLHQQRTAAPTLSDSIGKPNLNNRINAITDNCACTEPAHDANTFLLVRKVNGSLSYSCAKSCHSSHHNDQGFSASLHHWLLVRKISSRSEFPHKAPQGSRSILFDCCSNSATTRGKWKHSNRRSESGFPQMYDFCSQGHE